MTTVRFIIGWTGDPGDEQSSFTIHAVRIHSDGTSERVTPDEARRLIVEERAASEVGVCFEEAEEPEPRPTTTCFRCGKDYRDRDMMPNPHGEGELCSDCYGWVLGDL
jgi:hypothetical protein